VNAHSRGIDLHTHSLSSDGTSTPTELVVKATSLGLSAIALTDHDTIAGLPEALSAAAGTGLELVPGIELSIEDGDDHRFHLLSYFFNLKNSRLNEVLLRVRQWRNDRNGLMIERAHSAGIDLTLDDVLAEAGPGSIVVGRPHFAAALVRKGLATSIQEAFDKFLTTGSVLHEPKPSLTPRQAADILHGAGGVTVIAHPGLIKWADPDGIADYIRELKDADAIDGIECYYPRHNAEQTGGFVALAEELNLLVTGGSDYHGGNKPDIPLGIVWEGRSLPATLLETLREASIQRGLTSSTSVL
jgi:3',5'-nucleoside bisphosphate phosphatase